MVLVAHTPGPATGAGPPLTSRTPNRCGAPEPVAVCPDLTADRVLPREHRASKPCNDCDARDLRLRLALVPAGCHGAGLVAQRLRVVEHQELAPDTNAASGTVEDALAALAGQTKRRCTSSRSPRRATTPHRGDRCGVDIGARRSLDARDVTCPVGQSPDTLARFAPRVRARDAGPYRAAAHDTPTMAGELERGQPSRAKAPHSPEPG